jgi:hypothetical protein|tara:strand:- start:767 stop:997 length:231 start_codon:yes stop_codon:yes gene_type:complete
MNIFEGGRRTSKAVMGVWFAMVFILLVVFLRMGMNEVELIVTVLFAFIPPAIWISFVYVTGYIVRGFGGIKMGRDK